MSADSPVSILFDTNGNPVTIVNGALKTTTAAVTGNITSIAVSTSDVLLLASNPNRRGFIIYNDTTSAVLRIGFSTSTVSSTNFSVELSAGGFFDIVLGYTGDIRGIWSVSDSGAARITEFT